MKTTTTRYCESALFLAGVMVIFFLFVVPSGRRKPHAKEDLSPRSAQDGGVISVKKGKSFDPANAKAVISVPSDSTGV